MQISVINSATGRVTVLEAAASDTLASIKAQVQHREGIHPELQYLLILGHDTNDKDTLSDWGLEDGSQIHMVVLFKVFVVAGNKTITLDVDSYYSVELVKAKIQEALHIPPDQQILSCGDHVLENKAILLDCNIQTGARLDLDRQFDIQVIHRASGHRYMLRVKWSNDVLAVKEMVQILSNIPIEQQELHVLEEERGPVVFLEPELDNRIKLYEFAGPSSILVLYN